jgi:hypothetical protein
MEKTEGENKVQIGSDVFSDGVMSAISELDAELIGIVRIQNSQLDESNFWDLIKFDSEYRGSSWWKVASVKKSNCQRIWTHPWGIDKIISSSTLEGNRFCYFHEAEAKCR